MVVALYSAENAYAEKGFFLSMDGALHGGFIIPHDKVVAHLAQGHFAMRHFSLSGRATGNAPWHELYHFPEIGINFIHTDLGYPDVLGRAIAVFPHLTIKQFGNEKLGFFTRYGLGIAYITHTWNKERNFRNSAIGSSFNVALNISLELRWQLFAQWQLQSGLSFTHFSNGRVSTPNKGLNIAALKMGVAYQFKPFEKPEPIVTYTQNNNRPQIQMMASAGLSGNYPPGSKASRRFSFSSTASMPANKKIRFGAGYDFMTIEGYGATPSDGQKMEFFAAHGLHACYQQHLSKTSFFIQKGIYLSNADPFNRETFYHRAGFRYRIYERILLHLAIRTHYFKADHIETGIGFLSSN